MPDRAVPRARRPYRALALAFASAAALVAETGAVARQAGAPPPALDVDRLLLPAQPRIVGGEPSPAYPFMVSIGRAGGGHLCGGILIEPGCVLSAAHCVEQLEAGAVRAVVGARALPGCAPHLPGDTFETIAARPAWHVHPDYSGGDGTTLPAADLAVVQLARPVSPRFPPAVLNLKDDSFPAGGRATAVGFGFTAFDAGAASCELNRVVSALAGSQWLQRQPGGARTTDTATNARRRKDLPLVSKAECAAAYFGQGFRPSLHLCAGGEGRDSCFGDSGGPLLRSGEVIGVVSAGKGCGGAPGIYTRLAAHRQWLGELKVRTLFWRHENMPGRAGRGRGLTVIKGAGICPGIKGVRAIQPVEPEDDYGDDADYADDGADDGASGGGGLPRCKDAKRWRKNRSCPLWAALGECKANRAFMEQFCQKSCAKAGQLRNKICKPKKKWFLKNLKNDADGSGADTNARWGRGADLLLPGGAPPTVAAAGLEQEGLSLRSGGGGGRGGGAIGGVAGMFSG